MSVPKTPFTKPSRKIAPSQISTQLKVFKETLAKRKKYVKQEYQAYGLQLAEELGDWKNRSLYIRLAKNEDRKILEKARLFIKDQSPGTIKTPYKLFMWKLKRIRQEKEQAQPRHKTTAVQKQDSCE
jgi:hypothetical protein